MSSSPYLIGTRNRLSVKLLFANKAKRATMLLSDGFNRPGLSECGVGASVTSRVIPMVSPSSPELC